MGFEPRTFEGHMDWQFSDNRGPVDPNSPFIQLTNLAQANNSKSSIFGSGSSFTNSATLSEQQQQQQQPQQPQQQQPQPSAAQPQQQAQKQQQPTIRPVPPSTRSIFSPQILRTRTTTAPPFRNPAFTTPRRPFDEIQFSEASGAESSPGTFIDDSSIVTATPTATPGNESIHDSSIVTTTPGNDSVNDSTIDYGALDRDLDMIGALSPTRIDKNTRYRDRDRAFSSARKLYSSGKGEISRHPREYSARDLLRKRRRHGMDKGGGGGRGWDTDDDEDGDDDDEAADFLDRSELGPNIRRPGTAGTRKVSSSSPRKNDSGGRRPKASGAAQAPEGVFGSFLSAVDRYPDVPERLSKWGVFMLNTTVLGVVAWFVWGVVAGIRHDMAEGIRAEQETLRAAIARCSKQYNENKCVSAVPALKDQCETWWNCMMQAPESHFRFRIFARHFAETINEFANTMGMKAWGFFFAVLLIFVSLNVFGRRWWAGGASEPAFRQPDQHHHHYNSGMPQPSPYPHFGGGVGGGGNDIWGTPRQHSNNNVIGTPGLFGAGRHLFGLDGDGATDSDATPEMMTNKAYRQMLAPPQTPSSRRSPTKQLEYDWARARSRSPTKARSPVKYY